MGYVLHVKSNQLGLCRAVPGGLHWRALTSVRMHNIEGCREMRLGGRTGSVYGAEHVGGLSLES